MNEYKPFYQSKEDQADKRLRDFVRNEDIALMERQINLQRTRSQLINSPPSFSDQADWRNERGPSYQKNTMSSHHRNHAISQERENKEENKESRSRSGNKRNHRRSMSRSRSRSKSRSKSRKSRNPTSPSRAVLITDGDGRSDHDGIETFNEHKRYMERPLIETQNLYSPPSIYKTDTYRRPVEHLETAVRSQYATQTQKQSRVPTFAKLPYSEPSSVKDFKETSPLARTQPPSIIPSMTPMLHHSSSNVDTGRPNPDTGRLTPSAVLQGHYDDYMDEKKNLTAQHVFALKPITQLSSQLNDVCERISDAQDIYSRKYTLIQDQINSIVEKIEEDKAMQSEIELLRKQEVKIMKTTINEQFDKESELRSNHEHQINLMIDEKAMALKQLASKEGRIRFQEVENVQQALQCDLPSLQERIYKSAASRSQKDADVNRRATELGALIMKQINEERGDREQTQSSVLSLLRDTVGRVKQEIDMERKDRLASQETILGLLENQCTVIGSEVNKIQ